MKMVSSRLFTMTLLVIFTLNTFLPQTESVSCCMRYAKTIPKCSKMKGFTIQTSMNICNMEAIMFHPKKGKPICADPAKAQTQWTIRCLNARAKRLS
ncbi:hypothetical protein GJAV_G00083690 [Gymnothorax javanicus]|nr:hypothetical protein GJAV_G00083690 [Gymnothorax javanicus]